MAPSFLGETSYQYGAKTRQYAMSVLASSLSTGVLQRVSGALTIQLLILALILGIDRAVHLSHKAFDLYQIYAIRHPNASYRGVRYYYKRA